MRYLKTYESFNDFLYKSDKQKELEINLTDILDDVKIDGFDWLGFVQEAGSFGITNVDINIYFPGIKENQIFEFKEIENTVSHLHSYLSDMEFKLTEVSIVLCSILKATGKSSIELHNRNGISYPGLLTAFYNPDGSKMASTEKIRVLKLSFNK